MDETRKRADKKALWIWEGYLVLSALLPAAGSIVLVYLPIPEWIGPVFTGVWLVLCLFFALFFIPVQYKRFSYRLTEDRLEVHTGVIYTHDKAMPVSSVKYLSTFDGPLERLCGLTNLVVFAAGNFIVVAGITKEQEAELRCRLLAT